MKRLLTAFVISSLTACGSMDTVDGLSRQVPPPAAETNVSSPSDFETPRMKGYFTYMADAGTYADCETGKKLPVAMEADFIGLERAYLGAIEEAGQPMLVSIEGSIVRRPPMEGIGTVATVRVDRFIAVHPGEVCPAEARPNASFTDTRWVVTGIRGTKVDGGGERREPFLLFEGAGNAIRGFAGCNQLMGTYTIEGSKLTLSPLSTTKMHCTDTMEIEDSLLAALRTVTGLKIAGDSLTLFDSKGKVIRLEARYLE